eukprot:1952924-Alexandrium_andersonii.AAC.1
MTCFSTASTAGCRHLLEAFVGSPLERKADQSICGEEPRGEGWAEGTAKVGAREPCERGTEDAVLGK